MSVFSLFTGSLCVLTGRRGGCEIIIFKSGNFSTIFLIVDMAFGLVHGEYLGEMQQQLCGLEFDIIVERCSVFVSVMTFFGKILFPLLI